MLQRLQNLHLDQFSFWFGVLSGILATWLLLRLRKNLSFVRQFFIGVTNSFQNLFQINTENQIRRETIAYAQQSHVASDLFPLDEIVVPPQVLPSQFHIHPDDPHQRVDIVSQLIPFMPDWPELSSTYNSFAPSLSAVLEGEANLILMGRYGSGKTTALLYLASQFARNQIQNLKIKNLLPIYIHVNSLDLSRVEHVDISETLAEANADSVHIKRRNNLKSYLRRLLTSKRALFLIDGLDEHPVETFDSVTQFLQLVDKIYPGNRWVVATSIFYLGNLTSQGFIPVVLKPWEQNTIDRFTHRWLTAFARCAATERSSNSAGELSLLYTWLRQQNRFFSPFEITILTWGLAEGTQLNATLTGIYDNYLGRLTEGKSSQYNSLCDLAGIFLQENSARLARNKSRGVKINTDELISKRILDRSQNDQISFHYPGLLAYLASKNFPNKQAGEFTIARRWEVANLAHVYASLTDSNSRTHGEIETKDDLYSYLTTSAFGLRYSEANSSFSNDLLKTLLENILRTSLPMTIRTKLAAACTTSNDENVNALFLRLLGAKDPMERQLGALGCGMLKNNSAVDFLLELLNDPLPNCYRAACLALVSIGSRKALQAVSEALVDGHEDLQRAAAEALANHPQAAKEEFPKAIQHENLLVRRAAIFGLQRMTDPWAFDILKKLQTSDKEWLVKDAAVQAVSELETLDTRIPRPVAEPANLPWVLKYSSTKGIGLTPGHQHADILLSMLQDSSEIEKVLALDYLALFGDRKAALAVVPILEDSTHDLCENAYQTLYFLSLKGAY